MTNQTGPMTTFEEASASDESLLVFKAAFHRKRRGPRTVFSPGPTHQASQPTRLALSLALAHKIQQAILSGHLRDRAHAAKVLGITRARMTQNLNLLNLAPDIQEEILRMEFTDGRAPISQASLRPLVAEADWGDQRRLWNSIVSPE